MGNVRVEEFELLTRILQSLLSYFVRAQQLQSMQIGASKVKGAPEFMSITFFSVVKNSRTNGDYNETYKYCAFM